MIEKLSHSSGNVVGYKISGVVGPEDYKILVPETTGLVNEYGKIRMLLNIQDLEWEKISAWTQDLKFGADFGNKIEKMAFVSDKNWEKKIIELAAPFYASEVKFFPTDMEAAAWEWLKS